MEIHCRVIRYYELDTVGQPGCQGNLRRDGLLLILGEPGAGKTTILLDLARTLLERAGEDIKERVLVIVNLSSWKKKQPLAEGISSELSEKYRVPRKIGRLWLQRGYLLPLLDGLDEVATATQPDCVARSMRLSKSFNRPDWWFAVGSMSTVGCPNA